VSGAAFVRFDMSWSETAWSCASATTAIGAKFRVTARLAGVTERRSRSGWPEPR